MFGGLAFLVRGNLLCAVGRGHLIVRGWDCRLREFPAGAACAGDAVYRQAHARLRHGRPRRKRDAAGESRLLGPEGARLRWLAAAQVDCAALIPKVL